MCRVVESPEPSLPPYESLKGTTTVWPDNETDLDYVNFEGVADTIAEIIVQADGRPVSIGVSGAWGVGKSTLIKLTRVSLGKHEYTDAPHSRFIFVEFNAWLYQ